MTFWGTHIVVTSDLIFEVLHVPRVAHPDYPGCECLRIMSRDELLSHFCETPSIWGGKQNTPCSGFAKGLRFLNMVMTFVLTPLSHYNSIVRTYVIYLLGTYVTILCNWLILWQNAFYLYLGRSRMCLILQETVFQDQLLKTCKFVQDSSWRSAVH